MKTLDVGTPVLILSGVLLFAGLVGQDKEMLAFGTVLVGVGYGLRDYFASRPDSITVMTCYVCSASLWFGLGNLAGYWLEGGRYADAFWAYEAEGFLFEAQVLASLGVIVPPVAFGWIEGWRGRRLLPRLPRIAFSAAQRSILPLSLSLTGLGWAAWLTGAQPLVPSAVWNLVELAPNLAIFQLTIRWIEASPRGALPRGWMALPVVLMAAGVVQPALFSYMRSGVVWPVLAFCLPFVLRKALTPSRILAGLLFLTAFIAVFEPLGELRGVVEGQERAAALAEELGRGDSSAAQQADPLTLGAIAVLARLSTFNQLSQVVAIAHEEGFYHGKTLEYLGFVFIPRALWPEKPTVAPGQWFAEKLGRGRAQGDSAFSNAINMTIPGELYLNFGWSGTILGLAAMGLLYFLLWEAAGFFDDDLNLLGRGFALALMNQAFFGGSHLGAVVNLIAWYGLALVLAWILSLLASGRPRPAHPREHERRHKAAGASEASRA